MLYFLPGLSDLKLIKSIYSVPCNLQGLKNCPNNCQSLISLHTLVPGRSTVTLSLSNKLLHTMQSAWCKKCPNNYKILISLHTLVSGRSK